MHSAVRARKPMFIEKFPHAVKVNRQFISNDKKITKTASCQILARLLKIN